MPGDITPGQARSETMENLLGMANLYRVGTGAHTVVTNEINRREEKKKYKRKLLYVVCAAICTALISLLFWWLRVTFL